MTKNIKKTRCLKSLPIEGEVGGGLPRRFGDLAQLYYPDHNYQSALRLFREEMHLTRGMWKAMRAEGYKENTKILTRSQVRTIVQFLGEP